QAARVDGVPERLTPETLAGRHTVARLRKEGHEGRTRRGTIQEALLAQILHHVGKVDEDLQVQVVAPSRVMLPDDLDPVNKAVAVIVEILEEQILGERELVTEVDAGDAVQDGLLAGS